VGVLRTCCGSGWRTVNRAPQQRTDPRVIPGSWGSKTRTRWHRTDNRSRSTTSYFLFLSLFLNPFISFPF
jgi:hypothetical protein